MSRRRGRKAVQIAIALILLNEIRGVFVVATIGWPILRGMFQ